MNHEESRPLSSLIVGAGISGLTLGCLLHEANQKVTVLERSERPGGSIETLKEDGYLLELGPNTVLNNNVAIDELIRKVGLEEEKLIAGQTSRKRFIFRNDRLVPLPGGPIGFLTTPVFSWKAKFRLLAEPFIGRAEREETIAEFVTRRLGPEFLTWAVGPFVSGVYAGDASRLSVRWATRKIYALEEKYGGLIRGALAKRKGPQPAGGLLSFREGLGALPNALGNYLGSNLHHGCAVQSIHTDGKGFSIISDNGSTYQADRVIITGDAKDAARILDPLGETEPLSSMPYAGVIVVGMGFSRDAVKHPLDGFGFLVPPFYNKPILGCLFPSTLFPGRAPEDRVLLTAFLGGSMHMDVLDWEDDRVMATTMDFLRPLLGITGDPSFVRMKHWPRAIPQYTIGHGERVRWAEEMRKTHPGLEFAGNLLSGVSVADCIGNASVLMDRLLHS
ncbi:MAG TPA: protoporphyrinogen oxidase [Thermoanaerobaculia bacterium]|nr:protoporphyrinogen oxidase [Thermoanaerobaculia bacterium]HUM28797.1 protoporphyrinogen oxidase [Thermoanaerobaculia bacterium]HXK69054.1 protoporphyrinogen oxidase [Thermoanaerobaculia bacterium]